VLNILRYLIFYFLSFLSLLLSFSIIICILGLVHIFFIIDTMFIFYTRKINHIPYILLYSIRYLESKILGQIFVHPPPPPPPVTPTVAKSCCRRCFQFRPRPHNFACLGQVTTMLSRLPPSESRRAPMRWSKIHSVDFSNRVHGGTRIVVFDIGHHSWICCGLLYLDLSLLTWSERFGIFKAFLFLPLPSWLFSLSIWYFFCHQCVWPVNLY